MLHNTGCYKVLSGLPSENFYAEYFVPEIENVAEYVKLFTSEADLSMVRWRYSFEHDIWRCLP